ncbi:MAG: lysophospholipid acyltransferase family protein [Gemmatales bacterium]|nr:lysophospholipid acyltransferase family protein [Gemmatales bacterium]MDW7994122.1 lysophospholipid acyltransferase family protein [Gemmatales bacterium]
MKIRHPYVIRSLATLAGPVVRAWMTTLCYRYSPECRWVHPQSERTRQRLIYALWHEALLVPAGLDSTRPVVTLISQHADGEWLAYMCRCFGVRVVRGSTRRGGSQALRELIEIHTSCHILVTPDGPRGPRRCVQPGIAYLASRTGLPIVPIGVGFGRAWRFRSWDRFALPMLGSTVYVVAHPPIHVPPDLNREQLTPYLQQLQRALDLATQRAELWAVTGQLPRWPSRLAHDGFADAESRRAVLVDKKQST